MCVCVLLLQVFRHRHPPRWYRSYAVTTEAPPLPAPPTWAYDVQSGFRTVVTLASGGCVSGDASALPSDRDSVVGMAEACASVLEPRYYPASGPLTPQHDVCAAARIAAEVWLGAPLPFPLPGPGEAGDKLEGLPLPVHVRFPLPLLLPLLQGFLSLSLPGVPVIHVCE